MSFRPPAIENLCHGCRARRGVDHHARRLAEWKPRPNWAISPARPRMGIDADAAVSASNKQAMGACDPHGTWNTDHGRHFALAYSWSLVDCDNSVGTFVIQCRLGSHPRWVAVHCKQPQFFMVGAMPSSRAAQPSQHQRPRRYNRFSTA